MKNQQLTRSMYQINKSFIMMNTAVIEDQHRAFVRIWLHLWKLVIMQLEICNLNMQKYSRRLQQ